MSPAVQDDAGDVASGIAASPGSLRLGVYDLNSEFDALKTASLFLNSAHGIVRDHHPQGVVARIAAESGLKYRSTELHP